MDYGRFSRTREASPRLSETVLRTARLEETLTEGEKSDPAEEGMSVCFTELPFHYFH